MRFQVVIAGGRDFSDYQLLCQKCDIFFRDKTPTAIISGMARGADSLGVQYAQEHGIQIMQFPADWAGLGKRAGMVRNLQMLDVADAVIAFWNGVSRGTGHMVSEAKKRGLPLRVVRYREKGGE